MKRIFAYVAAVVLAFACVKPAPDPELPPEKEPEQQGPVLRSITLIDNAVTLEPGGSAELHFKVEDADYKFDKVSLLGTDGNVPSRFHLESFKPDSEQGRYIAVIQNDTSDESYNRTVKLSIETAEGTSVQSSNFLVVGKLPKPGMVHTGLPVVFVDTQNGQAITSKETFVNARMSITGTETLDGLQEVACSIRGRGNTTWTWPKKPYLVKLEEKASVFGFPKHKRWVLLANFMDRTMMRNMVAMKVSSMTSLAWTPRCQPVELVLNGKHVGNYLLIEQVRVDNDRINITEMTPQDNTGDAVTGGYLLELDFHYDNEFQWKDHNIPFAVKYPDPEDLTSEQKTYIKEHIKLVSNVLYGSNFTDPYNGYARFLDVDSFIDYWIVFEVMTNHELGNPGSVFIHKDRGGKLVAGPCWDFDWGVLTFDTTGGDYRLINRNAIWYNRLFQDPVFLEKTRARIRELLPQLETIPAYIDECEALLKESAELNCQMWDPAQDASQNGGHIINGDERMSFHDAVQRIKKNYLIHLQLILDTL